MTVAAVMTVRNEETLLRSNLLYHHFLGVDHFFIYADRCEDRTVESVSDLPFVEIVPVTRPEALKSHPDGAKLLARIRANPARFGPRIAANAFHATFEARRRGWDWLLHIDADELVCIDQHVPCPRQLSDYLDDVDPEIEVMRFRPFEICQRQLKYGNVFAEETLFKSPDGARTPLVDRIFGRLSNLGRCCFRTRKVVDTLLRLVYPVCSQCSGTRTTRKAFDPIYEKYVNIAWFYGHLSGKTAARLSADLVPKSCHEFVHRNGQKPREKTTDYLLHYFAYSFDNFVARARIRSEFSQPLISTPKSLFIDVVNRSGLSHEELRDYYERWVLFSPGEIESFQRDDPDRAAQTKIVEISGAKNTFELMKAEGAGNPLALSGAA